MSSCARPDGADEECHWAEELRSVLADARGSEGPDTDGPEPQDERDEHTQELGDGPEEFLQRLASCVAEHETRNPEKHRENDDLRHIALGESLYDVGGDELEEHVDDAGNGAELFGNWLAQLETAARLDPRCDGEAKRQRRRRCEQVIGEDLDPEPPEKSDVSQIRDGGQQVEEDERDGGHQQETNEQIADRFDDGGALAENESRDDADPHEDEDLQTERQVAVSRVETRHKLASLAYRVAPTDLSPDAVCGQKTRAASQS